MDAYMFVISLNPKWNSSDHPLENAPTEFTGVANTYNGQYFDVVFAADDGGGGEIL